MGEQWHTLKQAADIVGKSKSAIEYHAGKLADDDVRKDPDTGIILISDAALDKIRCKLRTSTQQVPKNRPTSTQDVPKSEEQTAQQVPEKYPTSTQQVPKSAAESAALDVLRMEISRKEKSIEDLTDKIEAMSSQLHSAEKDAAAARAELDAERRHVEDLKQQLTEKDKQIKEAMQRLAAEQMIHAGTISQQKQLTTAIDTGDQSDDVQADQDAKPAKRGFFARIFRKKE